MGAGAAAYAYKQSQIDSWAQVAQASEGMKLVEVDFAEEMVDGDMRELKVGEGK